MSPEAWCYTGLTYWVAAGFELDTAGILGSFSRLSQSELSSKIRKKGEGKRKRRRRGERKGEVRRKKQESLF